MAEELSLDHFDLGTFVDYVHALKQERDALRAQAIQDGEAVEVVTTWHPDSRSYEEQIVKHDTKGSRKSLGAMNAKLRAKVGRLERELSTVKQSLTVEPVAYAAFADNGNIRMWCRSAIGMCELFDAHGNKAVPLYTHPSDQVEGSSKQIAWMRRDEVMGCKRFITQKCYDAQSPQMKGNYEPFYCAHCKADQVAEPDAELVELLRECRNDFAGVSMSHTLIQRIDAKLASQK